MGLQMTGSGFRVFGGRLESWRAHLLSWILPLTGHELLRQKRKFQKMLGFAAAGTVNSKIRILGTPRKAH